MTVDAEFNRHSDMGNDLHDPHQQALVWLTRRQSGAWHAADQHALDDWLAAEPAHAQAWLRAQGLWQGLDQLRPLAREELTKARHTRVRAHRVAPRWAAGLALASVVALVVGLVWLTPGGFAASQVIQTARGEQRTLTLADGSQVELNTASRVEVNYSPFCRCLKLLSGEAVFKVSHSDVRAFDVQVAAGSIHDFGTVFWLRDEPGRIAVAVLEGEVEVRPGSGVAASRLQAGERYAFDQRGQRLLADQVPLSDLTAWREGALVFRDAPLTQVLAEFARYHDIHLQLDSRLAAYRLSGRFVSNDLDGVLKLLKTAYPISVERPSSGLIRLQQRG